MKKIDSKQIVTAGLLLFVAASVVALGVRQRQSGSQAGSPPAASGDTSGKQDKAIVFFFHRHVRCPTCITMEAWSLEAINEQFAEALLDGRIEWRTVDYERAENQHYRVEFDLLATSLVVVAVQGGEQTGFQNLHGVWPLSSDRDAFIEYVQRELGAFLERL